MLAPVATRLRDQLDKIGWAIKNETFRFKKTFPKDRKADFFDERERQLPGRTLDPDQLNVSDFYPGWFDSLRSTGRR